MSGRVLVVGVLGLEGLCPFICASRGRWAEPFLWKVKGEWQERGRLNGAGASVCVRRLVQNKGQGRPIPAH